MNKMKVAPSLKASVLAGMLAVTVLLTGCSQTGGALGGKVATVDGTVISKAEYDKAYNDFSKVSGLEKMPQQQRQAMTEIIKQMTLQKLIMHTLISTEAEKAGIKVTDAEVTAYKKKTIFDNPTLSEQFKTFLSQNKMTEADFDAILKENMLMNKFMEAKGGKDILVSDAEIKTIYDKNVEQFKSPEGIHAQHILIKAVVPEMKKELRDKNPKITDAELDQAVNAEKQVLKAKAEKLFKEVQANPAKFNELAKTNSDDEVSARNGGDLGVMAEANTDPDFWAALTKTPDKKFYPSVVPTMFGYHIIKVIERKPAHQGTLAEVHDFLKERIAQEKKQEFLKKWTEEKKGEVKIVIEPAYQPKAADPMAGAVPAPGAPAAVAASEAPATKH